MGNIEFWLIIVIEDSSKNQFLISNLIFLKLCAMAQATLVMFHYHEYINAILEIISYNL